MSGCPADLPLHLSVVQAAVLGLTQGLSEFLPVSSSGHLILVPWALGWRSVYCAKQGNKFFDVALHLGTFAGAAWYLRRDLWSLIVAWFASVRARAVRSPHERLAWFLVLSAIPGALAGALFEEALTKHLGQPWQIAVFLAVFGALLWFVDARAPQRTGYDDLHGRQVGAMAVAQAVALMPGVSRSGITITAARATGVTRDAAARFSFLMSLPIILGAGMYSVLTMGSDSGLSGQGVAFAVGMATAAVSGAAAVFGMLTFLRRHTFGTFAVYRAGVALLVLLLVVTGVRGATI